MLYQSFILFIGKFPCCKNKVGLERRRTLSALFRYQIIYRYLFISTILFLCVYINVTRERAVWSSSVVDSHTITISRLWARCPTDSLENSERYLMSSSAQTKGLVIRATNYFFTCIRQLFFLWNILTYQNQLSKTVLVDVSERLQCLLFQWGLLYKVKRCTRIKWRDE